MFVWRGMLLALAELLLLTAALDCVMLSLLPFLEKHDAALAQDRLSSLDLGDRRTGASRWARRIRARSRYTARF